MPISSFEIAQLNNQFQQATMAHMQHANMIGQMHNPDAIAGSMMNTGSALAGPMAMGGMALLGADPFSVGVSTTMKMAPRMGMMGAGMAGLGAAGLVGAGIMGAQYIGGQMMQGAQQQQQLGAMLNTTNPFVNSQGGIGFTRTGIGNIGANIRNMTTEQGPMGQMAGFEELGRLASNMGRMGMTQGVRDAKDFSDRFKEMVKSVKEIAESMSTSLEEAQRMMSSMRQSGVFGGGNAAAVAQKIRAGALGGGLATSELTGMMQVGSQISRMVGGRGRAGAMGGIEAITNIGVAQQMGIMSEEDIYNVTGLTGAEGRRAMATRQMQQSAQFLQGGIGRRVVAALAGENGQLDESSLEEMLSGGVGTGRLMQMANRNLSKIGKANFIRNEGKLRGEVMGRLGGLAPMMSLSAMLKDRGINVNEDSDRAMIFMQRQLGMGDDEANMMLRQVQNLPRILRERGNAAADDRYMSTERERLSQTGLEGVKNKLKKARAEVQASAQQVGAEIQQGLGNVVEETINRITDHHVRRLRRDMSGAVRSFMGGGAMGADAGASVLGIGGSNLLSGGVLESGTGMGGSLLSQYSSSAAAAGALDRFNDTDAERFKEAGFEFKGGSLSQHIQTVGQISDAFASGGAGLSGREGIAAMGKANARAFAKAKLSGLVGGKGFERLEGFGKFLSGLSGAGALSKRFEAADQVEKAQIMAAFGGSRDGNFQAPKLLSDYAAGEFHSESEAARGLGAAFTAGDRMNSRLGEKIGENLRSEEFLQMYKGLFSTDASARNQAITGAYDRLEQASAEHGKLGFFANKDRSLARIQALQGTIAAGELADLKASGASEDEINARVKELATQFGTSAEFVLNQAAAVQAEGSRSQGEARAQMFERFGGEARKDLSALRRGGLVTGTGSNLKLSSAALGKAGISNTGQRVLQAMLSEKTALAGAGAGSTAAEQNAAGQALRAAGAARRDALGSMSVAEMRELSESLSGIAGTSDMRSEISRTAGTGAALQKGGASAAASMLGLNIDKKQAAALMKGGGVDALAKEFATQMGGADNENLLKDLRSMLKDVTGGKAGSAAVKVEGFLNNEDVQKMLKKIQQEKDKQDPNKNLEQISNYMETLTKRSEATNAHLKTIADWTLKESESFF